MNTYIFELSWYNGIDDIEVKTKGIIPGNSYEDAMSQLTHYYGEEEIYNIRLELLLLDNAVIEVPEYVNLEDIKRMNEI